MLKEAKGIRSKRIYDIIKQHNGIASDDLAHYSVDLHNLTDNDVVGVIPSYHELRRIQAGHNVDHWRWVDNFGLEVWAKKNGFVLDKGDRVEAISLRDGTYLAVAVRNESLHPDRGDEGWAKFYKKSQERERNRYGDGSRQYNWINKDAEDIRKNPYFKKWPREHQIAALDKAREFNKRLHESISEKLSAERSKVNTDPTEGQKKAENYRMGHISINGFQISIENPKGSYRKGKDRNGKEWKTYMHNDYGYFVRTIGKDGDAIDVFIGDNHDSKKIFAVDQKVGGKFDETKVMFCFNTIEQAKKAYLSNYQKDWKGFWKITETDLSTFKKWLYDGKRQRKPFFDYVEIKNKKLNESLLKEKYEIVGKGEKFKLASNGSTSESIFTLKDESGQKFYIGEDDGCIVLYGGDDEKGYDGTSYIFPEAFNIMKTLPNLPLKESIKKQISEFILNEGLDYKPENSDGGADWAADFYKGCVELLNKKCDECNDYARKEHKKNPKKNHTSGWSWSVIAMVRPFIEMLIDNKREWYINDKLLKNLEDAIEDVDKDPSFHKGWKDNDKFEKSLEYQKSQLEKFKKIFKETHDNLNEEFEAPTLEKQLKDIVEKERSGKSNMRFNSFGKDDYDTDILTVDGGLNGSGNWSDYLEDILSLYNDLEANFKAWIVDMNVDCPDDVWTVKFGLEPSTKWFTEDYFREKAKEFEKENLNETKSYNVNMDIELPKAGRTAPKISTEELQDKITDFYWKYADDEYFKKDHKEGTKINPGKFLYRLVGNWKKESQIRERSKLPDMNIDLLKVGHDTENCDAIGGIRTTKSGIPYILGYMGGDWEEPILFMVYWDGKTFRGYIPERGNCYNRDTKMAFGNDEEADKKFILKNVTNNDGDYSKILRNISFNKEECIKDFESRLKVSNGKVNEGKEEKSGLDKFLDKHGIEEKECGLGYSETEKKWYGWSHRGIYGFTIGSKVKKGDVAYNGKEWTAKTMEDAKKMAQDYSDNIS